MSKYVKKDGTTKEYNYTKQNKIDELCDLVNAKYNRRTRQIGSIERHTDMTTNKIVQIANSAGGYVDLISGTQKQLETFLRNILSDKVNLNILGI